jgi:hypothetical protein
VSGSTQGIFHNHLYAILDVVPVEVRGASDSRGGLLIIVRTGYQLRGISLLARDIHLLSTVEVCNL